VAQKRRKKGSWLRSLLIFICVPLIVWFLAFLIWFYWDDITNLFTKENSKPIPKSEKVEPSSKNKAEEKILDEDRKKLDAIIKQRQ